MFETTLTSLNENDCNLCEIEFVKLAEISVITATYRLVMSYVYSCAISANESQRYENKLTFRPWNSIIPY